MISKQEIFKRILSGYYTSHNMVEIHLWKLMRERCGWSLTIRPTSDKFVACKVVEGNDDFYIKQAYENSPEWHEDIKECAKELGLL